MGRTSPPIAGTKPTTLDFDSCNIANKGPRKQNHALNNVISQASVQEYQRQASEELQHVLKIKRGTKRASNGKDIEASPTGQQLFCVFTAS